MSVALLTTGVWFRRAAWFGGLALLFATVVRIRAGAGDWFEIQVIDPDTRRGVPLVELETVDRVKFVTDNAGRVAFGEPGLMGKTVFFSVKSHGYEFPKDGFGMAGVRLRAEAGGRAVVEVKRRNIAERLYRITGAGLYRDTVLLGGTAPVAEPLLNAEVVGQDSAQVVVHGGRARWFWGDTSKLSYPLGNFRTSGATAELPGRGGLDPALGVVMQYALAEDGFTRQMCPFEPRDGVVWIDGLAVVTDAAGRERMAARFARLKSLGKMLEHGLAVFNDERGEFERAGGFEMSDTWRYPRGQATVSGDGAGRRVYYCTPFASVRARAEVASLQDPKRYEAWTCLEDGSVAAAAEARVRCDAQGRVEWRWTREAPPLSPREEQALVSAGKLTLVDTFQLPVDAETGKPVVLHSGSVRWNAWRQRWVLVAVELGGTSHLGEVWYGEAREITGPWRKVRKIVTHERYSFYNPVHHAFLDEEGGRRICFEGTYTREFSGNPEATPRYDYNQVMYRLDLADPRLAGVRESNGDGAGGVGAGTRTSNTAP